MGSARTSREIGSGRPVRPPPCPWCFSRPTRAIVPRFGNEATVGPKIYVPPYTIVQCSDCLNYLITLPGNQLARWAAPPPPHIRRWCERANPRRN